jgi:hypothetical protein
MKILSACRILSLTVAATSIFSWAKSTDQADPWSVLSGITHKRSYTIETRDHRCFRGKITRVTTDHLALLDSSHSPDAVIFLRADVWRVVSGRVMYYSGRSSWSDVSSLRVRGRGRLKIVTRIGKTYNVKPPYTVSDEGITLNASGKSANIPKSEIAQVYDIVVRPLTDFGDYSLGELGPMVVFDPDWYVRSLHLEQHVEVLLYNATEPEDDSPVQCAPK